MERIVDRKEIERIAKAVGLSEKFVSNVQSARHEVRCEIKTGVIEVKTERYEFELKNSNYDLVFYEINIRNKERTVLHLVTSIDEVYYSTLDIIKSKYIH